MYNSSNPLVLVTGGPGTGKTAVALWTARRILEDLPPGDSRRALFLTFSRAAVSELLGRAPGVLSGALGEKVEIATFHGFAAALIGAHGRYFGRGIDPLAVLTDPEEALGLGQPGALRYAELIPVALSMLSSAAWLGDEYRSRYAVVISDEYQDTGPEMASLLDLLSSNSSLICLADLDQMIYETLPNSGVSRARIDAVIARGPQQIELEPESHRDTTNLMPRVARAILNRQFGADAVREACAAGRLRVVEYAHHPDTMVREIRRLAAAGATRIGVFLTQRVMVEEAADRLRDEGIEHEIAGLGPASGYAQRAASALARFATGQDDWVTVRESLALFLAASYTLRRTPDLARMLADEEGRLPRGLDIALVQAQQAATALSARPLSEFLAWVRGFWTSVFTGHRGIKLWELGIDDLIGQSLAWANTPLDAATSTLVTRIANERHLLAAIDGLPNSPAPVQLMTVHQAKGRELDAVILIHDLRDYLPTNPLSRDWIATTRLHYVAISRARSASCVALPPEPAEFFAPYAAACGARGGN